jgi:predicted ATPase
VGLLLSSAPQVKVIVTSRERLRLAGEHEFAVPPLDEDDAVELFGVRARAASPAFRLELHHAPVLAICRRLDGLPLAVELAAARVKILQPRELLARLEKRLPILSGGPRDLPDRQRTLRATIDWSYQLLQAAERDLFTQLAVFVGGFTLEAAEAVTGASLDGLAALLDQSLLRAQESPDGERRFSMLETIREYAVEKLEQSDARELRERHSELFLGPIGKVNPWTMMSDLLRLRERMRSDLDNVRAALGWVLGTGDSERAAWPGAGAARMLAGAESHEAMTAIHALPTTGPRTLSQAKALVIGAQLAMTAGELVQAHAMFDEAWAISTREDDDAHRALCLRGLSHLAFIENDYERAELLDEQHLRLREAHGVEPDGALLITLAGVARDRGRFERADALYRQALARSRAANDSSAIAGALSNHGELAFMMGHVTHARALITEALAVAPIDDISFAALVKLAALEQWSGDDRSAAGHALDALRMFPDVGDLRHLAICLDVVAGIAVAQRQARDASSLIGAANDLRERIGSPVPAGFKAVRERNVALARDALGSDEFTAGVSMGRAVMTEDALARALRITRAALSSGPA